MLLGKRSRARQVVSIVFGERTTVVALLEKRGDHLALLDYLLEKAPSSEKEPAPTEKPAPASQALPTTSLNLAPTKPDTGASTATGPDRTALTTKQVEDHVNLVLTRIGGVRNRSVNVAFNMGEALVRSFELVRGTPSTLRDTVKGSPERHFKLPKEKFKEPHVFDCLEIKPPSVVRNLASNQDSSTGTPLPTSTPPATPPPAQAADTSGSKDGKALKPPPPIPVLTIGLPAARLDLISNLLAKAHGEFDSATATQIGLINAARYTLPPEQIHQVVAIVDIGFLHTTMSILVEGEPTVTFVVGSGGDRLTRSLATSMNVDYKAAEAVKLTMPEKVEKKLRDATDELALDMRKAIDYFENTYDRSVTAIFFAGGTAKSRFLINMLEESLSIPCSTWDPTTNIERDLPEEKQSEIKVDAPQLAIAIGVALSGFKLSSIPLNFLAAELEEREKKRRDPVMIGARLLTILMVLMLGWAAVSKATTALLGAELRWLQLQLDGYQKRDLSARRLSDEIGIENHTIADLHAQMTNRFLWTGPLNALREVGVDGIQVTKLKLEDVLQYSPGTPKTTNKQGQVTRGNPAKSTNLLTMTLVARDYSNPPAAEQFVQALEKHPYFRSLLKWPGGVRLKERLPARVDPFDPNRTFIPFVIECQFKERDAKDE